MPVELKIPKPRPPTPAERTARSLAHYERVGFTFLDQWSDGLAALSMPSRRLELGPEDLDAIVGVWDDRGLSPHLHDIAARLDAMLGWDSGFVRLNSRSPKDSTAPGLPITCSGKQAVSWILGSMRCFDDICLYRPSGKPLYIYLRDPVCIPEKWEVRCFVKNSEMIAATQYHKAAHNPQWDTPDGRQKTWDEIRQFYAAAVRQHVPRDNFVLDLYPAGGWRVLEINPYGMSDPILFTYAEIEAEGGFRAALRQGGTDG